MQFVQGTMQFEKEDPKMVKMKEVLSKDQLKIASLKRKNRDLKETTQPAAEKRKGKRHLPNLLQNIKVNRFHLLNSPKKLEWSPTSLQLEQQS